MEIGRPALQLLPPPGDRERISGSLTREAEDGEEGEGGKFAKLG